MIHYYYSIFHIIIPTLTWYSILSHIIPYYPILSHIIPYYPLLSHIIPYYPILSHIIPYYPHIIPYYPMLSHIIPYYPILSHIIPYYPRWCRSSSIHSIIHSWCSPSGHSHCSGAVEMWLPPQTPSAMGISFSWGQSGISPTCLVQWIGWEKLQESPIFHGKIDGFL